MEHTLGPWEIEHNGRAVTQGCSANGDVLLTMAADSPSREANARLIAAAPDLLEALAGIAGDIEGYIALEWDDSKEAWQALANRARVTIAKATPTP